MRHLDSGALYRAVTAARLRDGDADAGRWSEESVLSAARRCDIRASGASFSTTIDGADAGAELRSDRVTRRVSAVAQMQTVRAFVNDRLRAVAVEHDSVVDGRDIGTAVFPDAELKIFLMADPWERARRRLIQSLHRQPDDSEVAEETERLVQRDARDATQSAPARDAILIDTTHLTQAEQVDRIVALARAVTHRRDERSAIDLK